MAANDNATNQGPLDLTDERARAVEEAGRRAGAALRSPAPVHGPVAIQRLARRRRLVRTAAASTGAGVLLVGGLFAVRDDDRSVEQRPAETAPSTETTTPNTEAIAPSTETTTPSTEAATPSPETIAPNTSPAPPTSVAATAASFEITDAATLPGHTAARYSPDGSLLAAELPSDEVRILESGTLAELRTLPCPTALDHLPDSLGTGPAQELVWDGEAAASWDAAALTFLTSPHRPQLCDVMVSPDGATAVTDADVDGGQRQRAVSLVWNIVDGSLARVAPGVLAGFNPDGSLMVMADGPSVSVVETSTGNVISAVTDDATTTLLSHDGSLLLRWASTSPGAFLTIYDVPTLTPITTITVGSPNDVVGIEDPVLDAANGRVAALVGSGVTIWDATTGEELRHVPFDLALHGRSIAFSPDGSVIAVRNGDHLTVLDSWAGAQLADVDMGTGMLIDELLFSPDGVSLATAVAGSIRIWTYRWVR